MTKLSDGTYLFVHYGYDGDLAPSLTFLSEGAEAFEHFAPRDQIFTLRFDPLQRYCGGWHDLASAESFPCPDNATLPDQYDQCRHCQTKTGFNPAFYNAASVSPQQAARNQEPHLLYLAHFGPGIVKVGISWAQRDIRRLLDQGARSALILKTYPTADLARQYEAKISKLDGFYETLQARMKHKLLLNAYDAVQGAAELRAARERLVNELGMTPDENQPIDLQRYYMNDHRLRPTSLVDVSDQNAISGSCRGMIGSSLIMEQDGMQFMLPLTRLKGYKVCFSHTEETNEHAPQQVSLF